MYSSIRRRFRRYRECGAWSRGVARDTRGVAVVAVAVVVVELAVRAG